MGAQSCTFLHLLDQSPSEGAPCMQSCGDLLSLLDLSPVVVTADVLQCPAGLLENLDGAPHCPGSGLTLPRVLGCSPFLGSWVAPGELWWFLTFSMQSLSHVGCVAVQLAHSCLRKICHKYRCTFRQAQLLPKPPSGQKPAMPPFLRSSMCQVLGQMLGIHTSMKYGYY